MIFVGKFVGAIVSLKLATWLEQDKTTFIVCGALIGHVFDAIVQSKIERWRAERYWKRRAQAEANQVFFQSMFSMLGKLVVADGIVTDDEKKAVDTVMIDMLKLPRRARKEALQIFRMGQVSSTSFQYEAARFYEVFKTNPQSLENVLAMLFTVATADGNLKVSEEALIRSAAVLFNIPEGNYIQLRRRFTGGAGSAFESQQQESSQRAYGGSSSGAAHGGGSKSSSYEILGCSPSDPEAVIKQRYRKLVADFHPDKIVSKGLPEEFTKFANEKFKTIQQAYETIKAERKFH